MALVKCKDCGKDVSSDATRCTRCGAKNPGKRLFSITNIIIAIIVLFSFLQFLGEKKLIISFITLFFAKHTLARSPHMRAF
jgi:predicted amidophosphoribosyltransferase